MLSAENQAWLGAFQTRHGRKPRVLHIGNIANNAYNNAKILNQAGLDNDVVCYDYYHIMACPEWEDADFAGDIEDDFFPDWAALDLGDYQRPSWFVQGPVMQCLAYLQARARGNQETTARLWQGLGEVNKTVRPKMDLGVAPCPDGKPSSGLARARRYVQNRLALVAHVSRLDPVTVFGLVVTRLRRVLPQSRATEFLATGLMMVLIPLLLVVDVALWLGGLGTGRAHALSEDVLNQARCRFLTRREQLMARFAQEFPDRDTSLNADDFYGYDNMVRELESLMAHYDVVIGYATDPFLPLAAGRDYYAFEHGTIRDIPYQNDGQGRRTALAYRLARHVFVTNFDCIPSAQTLAPQRYTLINHPYDEDHGDSVGGSDALRLSLQQELDSDFLVFFPTRQDWVPGTGYADKANDVFLRAVVGLRVQGIRIGLVCCEWGKNVAQSRELLEQGGIEAHVKWVKPMAIMRFERMARACDCVADQFKLGAFGGVVFKAMAVGAPILSYLEESRLREQYPEPPPVINCRTEDDIVAALLPLVANPALLRDAGLKSRAWVKRYHGKQATVNAQLDQFRLASQPLSTP